VFGRGSLGLLFSGEEAHGEWFWFWCRSDLVGVLDGSLGFGRGLDLGFVDGLAGEHEREHAFF